MQKIIQWVGGGLLALVSGMMALLFFTPLGGDGFRERLREHYQHAMQAGREASAEKRRELNEELQKMNEGAPR